MYYEACCLIGYTGLQGIYYLIYTESISDISFYTTCILCICLHTLRILSTWTEHIKWNAFSCIMHHHVNRRIYSYQCNVWDTQFPPNNAVLHSWGCSVKRTALVWKMCCMDKQRCTEWLYTVIYGGGEGHPAQLPRQCTSLTSRIYAP